MLTKNSVGRLKEVVFMGVLIALVVMVSACGSDGDKSPALKAVRTSGPEAPTSSPELQATVEASLFIDLVESPPDVLALPAVDEIGGGLVFWQGGALYRAWFDGQASGLIGERVYPFIMDASPDADTLLFLTPPEDDYTLFGRIPSFILTSADLSALVNTPLIPDIDPNGPFGGVSGWSPDGDLAAVWAFIPDEGPVLVVMSPDGSVMQPLYGALSGAWMADGTLFVVTLGQQVNPGDPLTYVLSLYDPATETRVKLADVTDLALTDFLYLEEELHSLGLVYADTFHDNHRAALLPDGTRVYINAPLPDGPFAVYRLFYPDVCTTWEIRQQTYETRTPDSYQGLATLAIGDLSNTAELTDEQIQDRVALAQTYAEQVKSEEVLQMAIDLADLPVSVAELEDVIDVSTIPDTPQLMLTVTYDDLALTARIVGAVANALAAAVSTGSTPEQRAQIDVAYAEIERLEQATTDARARLAELNEQVEAAEDEDEKAHLTEQRDGVIQEIRDLNTAKSDQEASIETILQSIITVEFVEEPRVALTLGNVRADVPPEDIVYSVEETTYLSDITALPDGSLLFLQWKVQDCLFSDESSDMSVQLMRLVPGEAPTVITDQIDPGFNGYGNNINTMGYLRGRKYAVSPDGRYVFWLGGGTATGMSSIRVTDLHTGTTNTLMRVGVDSSTGQGGFDSLFWVSRPTSQVRQ